MTELAKIENVELREIWSDEAANFTPWLAKNIKLLADKLEMEIEIEEQEAPVGDFSLDLLGKDLGRNVPVVIENQLTDTDHDHLGKLLTYAAGLDAGVVIWVANRFREEHRQALDYLNQRTDEGTHFFGVVVEVIKIDDSRPAPNFKLVAFPNEWRKERGGKPPSGTVSPRGEAYRKFWIQTLEVLREQYKFTNARASQPANWYSFASGMKGITYGSSFALGGKARTEVYIFVAEQELNKAIFDRLFSRKDEIEEKFGEQLEWERLDTKRGSRIAIYTDGAIDDDDEILDKTREWMIEHLLRFKQVLGPIVAEEIDTISQH